MNIVNQGLIVVLFAYVKNLATLDEMKGWLAENVWDLSDSPSPVDRMILGEVELAMAELGRGHRDKEYLRRLVEGLLQLPNPDIMPPIEGLSSYPSADRAAA